MGPVAGSAPGERASAPVGLRMVEGLRRLRRSTSPQVVATRSVSARVLPEGPRQTVYDNPSI